MLHLFYSEWSFYYHKKCYLYLQNRIMMQHFLFPMDRFKELEPSLKQCFNIDRYTSVVSKCLYGSINPTQLLNIEIPEKYCDENGHYDIGEYSIDNSDKIKIPISHCFKLENLDSFFEVYHIETNRVLFDTLIFLYAYYDTLEKDYSTAIDEAEYDYIQYTQGVRPEMLKLYIALHETNDADSIKIRFGNNKAVEVDTMLPWFRNEIKQYLDKYLGVQSVKEAKREFLNNYAQKVGAPNNWLLNQYIWGLYNLLETTGFIKSKTSGKVSRPQAKFIEDYLMAIQLIDIKSNVDANNIRSRLNHLLKNFDSIVDITNDMCYKLSPNNNSPRLF